MASNGMTFVSLQPTLASGQDESVVPSFARSHVGHSNVRCIMCGTNGVRLTSVIGLPHPGQCGRLTSNAFAEAKTMSKWGMVQQAAQETVSPQN
jgi:hypothetical protein